MSGKKAVWCKSIFNFHSLKTNSDATTRFNACRARHARLAAPPAPPRRHRAPRGRYWIAPGHIEGSSGDPGVSGACVGALTNLAIAPLRVEVLYDYVQLISLWKLPQVTYDRAGTPYATSRVERTTGSKKYVLRCHCELAPAAVKSGRAACEIKNENTRRNSTRADSTGENELRY